MKLIKKSIFIMIPFLALATLSGCNTVQGVGEDVESGGKAIQRAAR